MNQDILYLINENTWFASDHHHGHKKLANFEPSRVIRATELGYSNYEEMLIAEHNKIVSQDDIVVFLGDFAFASPSQHASRYNGRKILVVGNHDDRGDHAYYNAGFEFVVRGTYELFQNNIFHCKHPDPKQSMIMLHTEKHNVALTHYPLGFDDGYNRQNENGSYSILDRMAYSFDIAKGFGISTIIHGHLHSKIADSKYFDYINVSLEQIDFKPVQLKNLL